MKLVTYMRGAARSVGVLHGPDILDLNLLAGRHWASDVSDVLGVEGWRALVDRLVDDAEDRLAADDPAPSPSFDTLLAASSLCPPVTRPSKVIGVGMNHRPFLAGIGEPVPDHPVLFHKTAAALTGSGQVIRVPPITTQVVPEGEVAVVIGRPGFAVPRSEVLAHIAGLTCANDLSARDLEFRSSQWTAGKMLPTFCPLGPALVTLDACPELDDLHLVTRLNGVEIQSGSSADLVFGVLELVSLISELVALEVGDVILTGTPSDLGALDPPIFLRHQDVIEVQVQSLGTLRNRVEELTTPAARSAKMPTPAS